MKAEKRGTSVVVTLTGREASDLEDELLWVAPGGRPVSVRLWETLDALNETEEADRGRS